MVHITPKPADVGVSADPFVVTGGPVEPHRYSSLAIPLQHHNPEKTPI
jgi:hypothetical protein